MTKITDQMTYIVIAGGTLMERRADELDRKSIVKDIADAQYEDLEQVFEFNPAEHTSREVTEDICREAAFSILESHRYDDLGNWQRDFIDSNAAGALIAHKQECRSEDDYNRALLPGRGGWGM